MSAIAESSQMSPPKHSSTEGSSFCGRIARFFTSDSGSRMVYVDYIRGLAMLTIIYVHTNAVLEFEYLTKYVYSFQIWIFFFISGFLCKKLKSWNDYSGFVWKNFVKLMVPYFACLPFTTLLNYLREEPVRALIDNIFYAHLSFGATWFLPALFLCSMIAVPLLSFSRSWPIPVVAGVGSFALEMFASNSNLISNYFRWQQALVAVPFFWQGPFTGRIRTVGRTCLTD